ncbi:hypothetical protein MyNCGM683_16040 [Achromobacter xylosoxidans]|uniref:Uncharacterized protein n=1 Tax=Alcaligenes xylosoxydans xylosoxydans TaxID=85698 RepID=A0A9X3KV38_ALCXX|nr:hypothetical protein [Achromobacter xylosoxidans]MCZ8400603.1 hypothetical protein [Achromobacter xylosoxidans]
MKMQESQVSVLSHEYAEGEPPSVFRLSGALSEWLFSSKFWANFNAKHGTMFDQYEEDEAPVPIINAIVEALDERIRVLQGQDEPSIEFVFRWTSENTPITMCVPRNLLISELIGFRNFLIEAAVNNLCVCFSL